MPQGEGETVWRGEELGGLGEVGVGQGQKLSSPYPG